MDSKPGRSSRKTPPPVLDPRTFVDLLCKQLVVAESFAVLGVMEDGRARAHGIALRDGFAWPVATGLPGLLPLSRLFDRVLLRTDGYTLEVVCILDRLSHPEQRVTAGLDELRAIGAAGVPHTRGTPTLRVFLEVWEVGAPDDREHLRHLHRAPGRDRVGVTALALGLAQGFFSNAPFPGNWARTAMARRAVGAVRASEPPTAPTAIGKDASVPIATYAILATLLAVYLLELALGKWQGLMTPTGASLIAIGALERNLVLETGQWYRMASATFLHASPLHLLMNGIALYFGGTLLERLIGRAWFVATYGLSALSGSLVSMFLNSATTVSVGASGAIVGLFGAALAVSYRIPYGGARTWMRRAILQVLVPALLPLFLFPNGPRIDFAGHLGGAIMGLFVGLFLLKSWPRNEPHPRHQGIATVIAAASALLLAAGLAMALLLQPEMARALSVYDPSP